MEEATAIKNTQCLKNCLHATLLAAALAPPLSVIGWHGIKSTLSHALPPLSPPHQSLLQTDDTCLETEEAP